MSKARDKANSTVSNFASTGIDDNADANAITIDSSENVGIGTASPAAKATIKTSSNEEDALLVEQSDGTDVGALRINNGSFVLQGRSTSQPVQIQTHDGNEDIEVDPDGFIKMETAGAEALRIDSNGHTMFATTDNVVQTNSGTGNGGVVIRGGANPYIAVASDGSAAGEFNRLANDGVILNLRKDGTTVGSIGNVGSLIQFGQGNANLKFSNASDIITPANGSGTNNDNALDLGSSSARFKDLYLSGGVYLGGTGSANLLHDYEEGTFTPTYTEGLTSVSYNFQQGKYTKTGRMVFFEIGIRASAATTNSNQIRIAGLPFTSSNTGGGPYGGAYLIYNNAFFTQDGGPTLLINYNDTELLFYRKSDGSIVAGNNGNVNELNDIYIVGQYTTNA